MHKCAASMQIDDLQQIAVWPYTKDGHGADLKEEDHGINIILKNETEYILLGMKNDAAKGFRDMLLPPQLTQCETEENVIELSQDRIRSIEDSASGENSMDNKLLYSIEADEENRQIIISPLKDGRITLYGPDWAEQFTDAIRRYAQMLWDTQR